MVGDRDNNDDEEPEVAPHGGAQASGLPPCSIPIYSIISMFYDQIMPALASSTATRSSISASTESSFSWPEPSLKSVARRFQPQQRALIQSPGQEAKLELVEGVERAAAMLDRAPAPFRRLLDALQRNERIDAAQRPQRHRRALRFALAPKSDSAKVPLELRHAGGSAVATCAVPLGP